MEKEKITLAKKKFLTKRKLIFLIILTLLLVIGFILINRSAIATETEKVSKGNITESLSASGEVTASKKAVLTFQTIGKIDSINVGEGEWVTEGQLIAKLDTTNLYQTYLSAEANLRSAQAALDKTYDTVQGNEAAESFADRATRTAAEATKDVSYRNFITAQHNLASARIVAPFSGILVDISEGVFKGINVSPATASFTIVDPATVYFNADVNEVDVTKLRQGQEVLLTLDAFPDDELKVSIQDVAFSSITTSTGGTAYPVKISLPPNSNNSYRLGMNGDAEFVMSSKKDVLLIPATAVFEDDNDKEYVWVSENGKAKKVEVETGISTIDQIEVRKGLSEGQVIINRPQKEIREGLKINSQN